MKREFTDREKWFIERIGKIVFRNKTSCPCFTCERVYNEGLYIVDESHALYVSDMESISTHEGEPLKYFGTKEEMLDFENTLK